MPQLQLPVFPAGAAEINRVIGVQRVEGVVWYIHGHLPVFHHQEQDVRSFRMFTSQMIVNGTVKPKEIAAAFGVPMVTVKRYVKVYRERGAKGFYEPKPRHSSAPVLKGKVVEQAQRLLDEGRSVPEVAGELRVSGTRCTRRSAPDVCVVQKKERAWRPRGNHQKRTEPARQPGGDGKWGDAFAGTSGGGDGGD